MSTQTPTATRDYLARMRTALSDLPPAEVINQGRDGEFIRRLLSSGRYDKEIATLRGVDYVLIRYGLNDIARREEFEVNFPKDYAELIGRLRRDFPGATIVPMTIIPYMTPERDEEATRVTGWSVVGTTAPVPSMVVTTMPWS